LCFNKIVLQRNFDVYLHVLATYAGRLPPTKRPQPVKESKPTAPLAAKVFSLCLFKLHTVSACFYMVVIFRAVSREQG